MKGIIDKFEKQSAIITLEMFYYFDTTLILDIPEY
jgi:hypothetical protein